MKYILILSLVSMTSFAGDTWDKTKAQINETAEGVERVTQKGIDKGKEKWQERQEAERLEEEKEDRAEYERLKAKYGKDEKCVE
jgi:hypothetical protein